MEETPKKRQYKFKHKRTGTNFKTVKIVRRPFGWYKRKHGIWLDPLLPSYQKLLKNNNFMKKFTNNEQVLRIIFYMTDMENQNKNHRKYWYNPHTKDVTLYKEFLKDSKYLEWKCAFCETPIRSSVEDFSPTNFCCDKCGEGIEKKEMIDKLIVQSSLKFTKHCKKILKAQQRMIKIYLKNK